MFEADDVRGWWASLSAGGEGSDEDPVLAPARVFSLARWKINLLCWSAAGACLIRAVVLTKLPQSRQITRSSEAENKLSKPVRIKIFWSFSLYWQTDDSTFLFIFILSYLVGLVAWAAPGCVLLQSLTAANKSFLVNVMSTLSFSVSSKMLGWGKVAVLGLSLEIVFLIFFLLLLLGLLACL